MMERIPPQELLIGLARRLRLRQRMVCIDLETTGTDPQTDRVVQLAGYAVHPVSADEGDYEVWAIGPHLVNPERPIPAEATAVHGITNDMVAGEVTFRELALVLGPVFAGGVPIVLVAFNGGFDRKFLIAEFTRLLYAEVVEALLTAPLLDPYRIYQQKCPRNLTAAVRHYCDRDHEADAHDAQADVVATVEVLVQQLDIYDDLPTSVAELDDFCAQRDASWIDREGKFVWKDGEAVCMVGKFRGVPLRKVDKTYLAWMAGPRCDFGADTKEIARLASQGYYPEPAKAGVA